MRISIDDVWLFTQTVIHGGISAAAEMNNMQRSKISRRLQKLESALGCQLLIRTTRHIELTEHGKRLFELMEQPIEHIQQGLYVIKENQQDLTGKIRLAVPSALTSSTVFTSIISEYSSAFPNIEIEIQNHQESVDLKRQGIDLQVLPCAVNISDDSYIQFSLLSYSSHFVASKQYLDSHPPITLENLGDQRVLTNRYNADLLDYGIKISMQSDDLNLLRYMAINGQGIAFIPELHSKPFIESGDLVEVLSDIDYPDQHLTLLYPSAMFLPKKVRVLKDLFKQKFG